MQFEIRSIDKASSVSTLTLDAPNREAAMQMAIERGLRILSIESGQKLSGLFQRKSSKDFPLGQFSQELLTLLDAGLALVESIETLSEKEHRPERRDLLNRLVADLYRGAALSRALSQFPDVFPPLYVATVRASERTGGLSEALGKYVAYQSQLDIVKKKVVSASIYPIVLAVAGLLVIGFLMGYVVPRFARIFEDLGGDIPWMSRLLIQWGHLARDYGGTLLVGSLALVGAAGFWLTRPGTPAQVLQWLQKLPSIGERLRVYQLTRFYRSLGMLLRGGMPAVASLELVTGLLPGALNQRLVSATQLIREGTTMSVAMENCGLTTPVSARMLRVGERTGQMGEMMERIALFYDSEISQWIDWFVRLFEPLLMAFIGLVIGFIVVVMYFPIFELAGSIR
ncbi:MAG: type II secretion system F family protein [Rhodoferax sp.]|uniref:type II secretion system F family protein n=1 Tax=Rhodoferax sp. TaxID=50421 RepID=UPI003017A95F